MYFILASLLVATSYEAYKRHYKPDYSVTLSLLKRTLMVQSTSFIVYLVAGGAVFARIEGWFFVDGVYWATVTLLTISSLPLKILTAGVHLNIICWPSKSMKVVHFLLEKQAISAKIYIQSNIIP